MFISWPEHDVTINGGDHSMASGGMVQGSRLIVIGSSVG